MNSEFISISSLKVPKIGFGTYQLRGKDGINAIEYAIQTGYRHIDTAEFYSNEEEVGKAVRNSGIKRHDIFITTKVWPSHFHRLIAATEGSLKALGLEYIDLLLLHWPSGDESNKKAVDLLNETLQKGYTKSIGVSNFNIDQLTMALARAPIVCNQVEYHPFLSQDKMIDFLRLKNMYLTAYSPLALGKVAKSEALQKIGKKYRKSASQIALRWLIQQGEIAVIPKSSSKERIKENWDITDFELSAEDMEAIHNLVSRQW